MSLSAFVLVDAILLIGNHTISEYLRFASLEEAVAPASDGAHRRSDPSGSNADRHQVKS